MAEAKITTDHDDIRNWAEQRGGHPATVRATHGPGHGKDGTGIIRRAASRARVERRCCGVEGFARGIAGA